MTAPAPEATHRGSAARNTAFGAPQVYAVAGCYFVASFAALGLPPYLSQILPGLGDPDARWAGLLYVVPTVFGALAAPVWGRLADRFGHKPLLMRAQFGLAGSFLLAGVAESLPLFAAALALQGLLGGTYAASNSFLGSSLHDARALSKALTLMQAAARAALVAAPVTVGVLSPWIPPHRQYLLMAALPLAAALMLTALPAPPRARLIEPGRGAPKHTNPSPAVTRLPYRLYALECGFVFATVVSFPYLVALVELGSVVPGELSGVMFAVPHVVYLVLAVPVHAVVSPRPLVGLRAGFVLVALGLAGHALTDSVAWFVAVRVVLGLGLTSGLVSLSVLVAAASRGRRAGRMFGWLELVSKAGAVASGLVAAAANAVWGPLGPMLVGAAAATCLLLVTARPRRSSSPTSTHDPGA